MHETIEFRIPEDKAANYLPNDLGVLLDARVRKVMLPIDDPWVHEIARLEKENSFFTYANVHRKYSQHELATSRLLHLTIRTYFEPAGEECGTQYDDTSACDYIFEPASEMEICGQAIPLCASTCGVGTRQESPLILDGRRLPKRVDFATTIAGETIVSRRVVDLFQDEGMTGANFEAIRLSNEGGGECTYWYQPVLQSTPVDIHANTRFGSNPFDNDQYGKCPKGCLLGLNLLSELWIKHATFEDSDFVQTRQFAGVRRGLLRPERFFLVSPKLWASLQEKEIKGCDVEVAHLA